MEHLRRGFAPINVFEGAETEHGLAATMLLAGIVRGFGLPDGLTFGYETLAITLYQTYRIGKWLDHVENPTKVP